jgi:hypothetical protein
MILKEEKRDLFLVPEDFYLAHCISSDLGMGKGIVVEFNKRYDMKNKLLKRGTFNWFGVGYCIREGRVINLITKEKYWNKPTYKTLEDSLLRMKQEMIISDINKVAMPLIGCGLDKLEWNKVKSIIENIFKDTDYEILVCKI